MATGSPTDFGTKEFAGQWSAATSTFYKIIIIFNCKIIIATHYLRVYALKLALQKHCPKAHDFRHSAGGGYWGFEPRQQLLKNKASLFPSPSNPPQLGLVFGCTFSSFVHRACVAALELNSRPIPKEKKAIPHTQPTTCRNSRRIQAHLSPASDHVGTVQDTPPKTVRRRYSYLG